MTDARPATDERIPAPCSIALPTVLHLRMRLGHVTLRWDEATKAWVGSGVSFGLPPHYWE